MRRPTYAAALIAVGVAGLWCLRPATSAAVRSNAVLTAEAEVTTRLELKPTVEAGDTEVLWQAPPKPVGVVFFAHGCQHSATDFWPAGSCDGCLGLPEEVRMTEAALRRGLAVIAVSSRDREGARCWDLQPGGDVGPVVSAVRALQRRLGAGLPLYAVGASSGGAFVQLLPHHIAVTGVAAQIMQPIPQLLTPRQPSAVYPRLLLVHMPRDEGTASAVAEYAPRAASDVAELQIQPRAVTEGFVRRSAAYDAAAAQEVVAALRAAGELTEDGLLVTDPRRSRWRAVLRRSPAARKAVAGAGDSLKADASPLSELLNLAWAGHEITSDHFDFVLSWMAGARSVKPPESFRLLKG